MGAAPVSHLLRARRETPLTEIMEPVTEIPVDMDQEEVAYIFDKYHLISAPVVEPGGRLVGQITVDDIVGVIQEESEEDMLALANVSDAGRDATVVGIIRSRIAWLVLNIFTEAVAVSAIAIFSNEVAKVVALAVLMPIVSSVGGQRRHPDAGGRGAGAGRARTQRRQRRAHLLARDGRRADQRGGLRRGDGRRGHPVLS